MKHVLASTLRLFALALLLSLCCAAQIQAQEPPKTTDPKTEQKKAPDDPYAPEQAPPLPAGMTGSDANDPRAKLTPGLYDAGETAKGMKHLMLFKKPSAFQLGSDDAANPKVQKTLGSMGVADAAKMSKSAQLVRAQLGFANSDLAFRGKYLFQGNFYGVNIFDISTPAKTKLVTSMICPGGQGDVSVYKNLMFMSVEQPNGRLDCSIQGFPPPPPPKAGEEGKEMLPAPSKERFRGVRIFDISNIQRPKQIAAV